MSDIERREKNGKPVRDEFWPRQLRPNWRGAEAIYGCLAAVTTTFSRPVHRFLFSLTNSFNLHCKRGVDVFPNAFVVIFCLNFMWNHSRKNGMSSRLAPQSSDAVKSLLRLSHESPSQRTHNRRIYNIPWRIRGWSRLDDDGGLPAHLHDYDYDYAITICHNKWMCAATRVICGCIPTEVRSNGMDVDGGVVVMGRIFVWMHIIIWKMSRLGQAVCSRKRLGRHPVFTYQFHHVMLTFSWLNCG